MQKEKVLKEFEEGIYSLQVLKNIKTKNQFFMESPKKAVKVLLKNQFLLAKEVLTNSHFCVVADISGEKFWHNHYFNKIKNIPGTIVLENKTSKQMKDVLEDRNIAEKLLFSKLKKMVGTEGESYKLLKEKEEVNFYFWYQFLSDLERVIFEKKTRQPILLVSMGIKYQARAGGIGEDPNQTYKIIEAICYDLLINLVYYRETHKNSPWMDYMHANRVGKNAWDYKALDEYFENNKKANQPRFSDKRKPLRRFLENRIDKINQNFDMFFLIPQNEWKRIWNVPKARKTVLKSLWCNQFLDYLFDNLDIEKSEYLENINKKQEVNSVKGFFEILKSTDIQIKNEKVVSLKDFVYGFLKQRNSYLNFNLKTSLSKKDLKIDSKELYYTKNLGFFEYCLKKGYYQETLKTEENASVINHLVVSEQWEKLQIMKKYGFLSDNIKDEDGHTPAMVLDLVFSREKNEKLKGKRGSANLNTVVDVLSKIQRVV